MRVVSAICHGSHHLRSEAFGKSVGAGVPSFSGSSEPRGTTRPAIERAQESEGPAKGRERLLYFLCLQLVQERAEEP